MSMQELIYLLLIKFIIQHLKSCDKIYIMFLYRQKNHLTSDNYKNNKKGRIKL